VVRAAAGGRENLRDLELYLFGGSARRGWWFSALFNQSLNKKIGAVSLNKCRSIQCFISITSLYRSTGCGGEGEEGGAQFVLMLEDSRVYELRLFHGEAQ
jgi:hypothetical protein